jgi:hypothetical protein
MTVITVENLGTPFKKRVAHLLGSTSLRDYIREAESAGFVRFLDRKTIILSEEHGLELDASNAHVGEANGLQYAGDIQPEEITNVPAFFVPLVRYLRDMHTSSHLTRYAVRKHFRTRCPGLPYGRKPTDINDVMDRAAKLGLIECGGQGREAWIRLRAE